MGKKKLIIIVVLILLLIGGGAAGWWFFLRGAPDDSASAEADKSAQQQAAVPQTAIYYPIRPPFVVNFDGSAGVRFLQIHADVLARSPQAIEAVKKHMPLIQNRLLSLFSEQNPEELKDSQSMEVLRQKAQDAVNGVMQSQNLPIIEKLLFTNFVMQ